MDTDYDATHDARRYYGLESNCVVWTDLVEHDGQEHDHLHVSLVGGGGRPQSDPIGRGVHHQPQRGCPADRATPTAPPSLRVPDNQSEVSIISVSQSAALCITFPRPRSDWWPPGQ